MHTHKHSYHGVGQDTDDPVFWYDFGVDGDAVAAMALSQTGTRLEIEVVDGFHR